MCMLPVLAPSLLCSTPTPAQARSLGATAGSPTRACCFARRMALAQARTALHDRSAVRLQARDAPPPPGAVWPPWTGRRGAERRAAGAKRSAALAEARCDGSSMQEASQPAAQPSCGTAPGRGAVVPPGRTSLAFWCSSHGSASASCAPALPCCVPRLLRCCDARSRAASRAAQAAPCCAEKEEARRGRERRLPTASVRTRAVQRWRGVRCSRWRWRLRPGRERLESSAAGGAARVWHAASSARCLCLASSPPT
jgi:hypothetical protein